MVNKTEIKRINTFLNDVHEGLCEGDEPVTMQLQLQIGFLRNSIAIGAV